MLSSPTQPSIDSIYRWVCTHIKSFLTPQKQFYIFPAYNRISQSVTNYRILYKICMCDNYMVLLCFKIIAQNKENRFALFFGRLDTNNKQTFYRPKRTNSWHLADRVSFLLWKTGWSTTLQEHSKHHSLRAASRQAWNNRAAGGKGSACIRTEPGYSHR